MRGERTSPGMSWQAILLGGLSLSVGWGVRGNWGHEYGAMIPGALCAMAACMLSGREDWRARVAFFGFFGALGWSLGGSMSYMQVIAYTHSGHASSQLYGYACLFALGFLWGAPGGAGTALPAVLDRDRMTEFILPLLAVFAAWTVQDAVYAGIFGFDGDTFKGFASNEFKKAADKIIDWHDTDWVAASLAIIAVVVLALVRKRLCWGSSLILHMAVGWWIGFLVLVIMLDIRMTPPRGDNWAGMTGAVLGMLLFFYRRNMKAVIFSSLVAGFVGGFGFSFIQMLKLAGIWATDNYPTNWHSMLEQSYGFVNGIGIALAMGYLSTRTPPLNDEGPPPRRWAGPFAVGFILIVITYINIRKNVPYAWLENHVVPEYMHGIHVDAWFKGAYAALALGIALIIMRHAKSPLALVPKSALGRGQLLFLLFLWWIVLANASRDFPFAQQRLVTEGVIHLTSILCTLLVVLAPREEEHLVIRSATDFAPRLAFVVVAGLMLFAAAVGLEYSATRKMFGDTQAPQSGKSIRFGPDATTNGKR